MTAIHAEMVYLGRSGHQLADATEDLRGMVVVDPSGLRLGEIEDVVIDVDERRARLLSVVSGGVLGMAFRRALVPVEAITRVDDRVHLGRTHADVRALARHLADSIVTTRAERPANDGYVSFGAVYEHYGVVPFWVCDRAGV